MNYIISMSYDVHVEADSLEEAKDMMYEINDENTDRLSYWYEVECTDLSVEEESD